jgi:predicted aminopeptidase
MTCARSLLLPILAAALLLMPGCYLLKQSLYTLEYHAAAQKIDTVLRDPALPPDERDLLRITLDVRSYASSTLGLTSNRNFTRYKRVDREYLVDVVSGSRKTAFEPYLWRFPFFGASPYKGFFDRKDAIRQAGRLEERGYEVLVRRVQTFSTLGYLIDPIYSFMKDYPVHRLAELIIHEQAHATLFLKGRVRFNEEFATFVGREGALGYVEKRYGEGSQVYRRYVLAMRDRDVFLERMRSLHAELKRLYGSGADDMTILREKRRVIERFKREFTAEYDDHFLTETYRLAGSLDINNAYILSVMRYTQELDLFYTLYESLDSDLPRMIGELRVLQKSKTDPRDYMRALIASAAAGS